jgi:hypothetical protein
MDKKIIPAASIKDILGGKPIKPVERMFAIPSYEHKTAGTLMYVPESQFKAVKRAMSRNGKGSSNMGRTKPRLGDSF